MAQERTLILVKPDGVERGLIGEIVTRLERKGISVIGLKMLKITPDLSRQHYAEHVERPFYPALEAFITSGPVVAICAMGSEVVSVVRGMMGPTNGRQAPSGTIRGDFGMSRQMNLIHGSDSVDSAAREIPIYFSDDELFERSPILASYLIADDEK